MRRSTSIGIWTVPGSGHAIRSSLRPSDLPCPLHGTGSAVIDPADVALYAAKNNGRNQTRIAAAGS